MKQITQSELGQTITLHQSWLNGEAGGERANLSGCDLSGCDLSGAILSWANLSGADLHNCIGNAREIKSFQASRYMVTWTKDILQIGLKWWKEWKPRIVNMLSW